MYCVLVKEEHLFKEPNKFKKINHERNIELWETSRRVYVKKNHNENYNAKTHRNWADEHIKGCTHFGLYPEILPRNMLIFDTLHMIMKIKKA